MRPIPLISLAMMVCNCGGDDGGPCQPGEDAVCGEGLVCEELEGGDPVCAEPVFIDGQVLRSSDLTPIEGARVSALDENGSAASTVAISDAQGRYRLWVPVARVEAVDEGDEYGLSDQRFTLRASAQDYQDFPGGVRPALPVDARQAQEDGEGDLVVRSAATDITLIPLPASHQGRPRIEGTVAQPEGAVSALVVAEANGVSVSVVGDTEGRYVIFNVPPGTYQVQAYVAGFNHTPAEATVDVGEPATDVDLALAGPTSVEVSGSVNIVNAPGDSATSVVLVVESTFSDMFVRGEVPPGLRAPAAGWVPDVTGAFAISGVPDGRYVVLAAFENDGLVRDPDPNIAGTQVLHLVVEGEDVTIGDSFKITEALSVVGPGADAPEAVTASPVLEWADDSSEDYYTVEVYDSFGTLVWQDEAIPRVTGSPTVEVAYGGPPLEAGLYYQFRATSWREGGGGSGPISQTEDLRGVFYVPATEP